MARIKITKAIKEKIISGLKRGKKPVDLARMNKVSVGYVYSLRSKEFNSTESTDSVTIATPVAVTAIVESESVDKAQLLQSTTVQLINSEISMRENEISVLKNTLNILYK